MACYQYVNQLGCVLHNVNASYSGVPISPDGSIWIEAPDLITRQPKWFGQGNLCDEKVAGTCFGIAVAVNQLAVAVSATGQDDTRFIQVMSCEAMLALVPCESPRK